MYIQDQKHLLVRNIILVWKIECVFICTYRCLHVYLYWFVLLIFILCVCVCVRIVILYLCSYISAIICTIYMLECACTPVYVLVCMSAPTQVIYEVIIPHYMSLFECFRKNEFLYLCMCKVCVSYKKISFPNLTSIFFSIKLLNRGKNDKTRKK